MGHRGLDLDGSGRRLRQQRAGGSPAASAAATDRRWVAERVREAGCVCGRPWRNGGSWESGKTQGFGNEKGSLGIKKNIGRN